MEGAGSCAEVNLMDHDIVNFPMAQTADAPVILVGDIHRGGIFAQLVGTLECLPSHYKKRIAGFLINRFRGDQRLFEDGVKWIEQKTGLPVFGVVPWYDHIRIDPEDSVVIERPRTVSIKGGEKPAIAVIRIPHISNFTDFDPLQALPEVDLYFVASPQDLSGFSAVILPGSKNTRFDLQWLKTTHWQSRIRDYQRRGGHITGICGGYQMMGETVQDPNGLEGNPGKTQGLGLLPVTTLLKAPKTTTLSRFSWDGIEGTGYEIHMGQSRLEAGTPLLTVHERNGRVELDVDGCISEDERALGTYMHGLFDTPELVSHWLNWIGLSDIEVPTLGGRAFRDAQYDLLAEHVRKNAAMDKIGSLVGC
jgi:adenosylcobyric acid synthase